jgi:hypothetical protein
MTGGANQENHKADFRLAIDSVKKQPAAIRARLEAFDSIIKTLKDQPHRTEGEETYLLMLLHGRAILEIALREIEDHA